MITPRQRDLLLFIAAYQAEHMCAPNFNEMAAGIGIQSKSGINRLLQQLGDRGYVRQYPARARAIEVLRMPGDPPVRCPHCQRLFREQDAHAASAVDGRNLP